MMIPYKQRLTHKPIKLEERKIEINSLVSVQTVSEMDDDNV